ncbi:acyl-CoA thioesterase [Gimesia aquarii]|uniref:1,4-dihydroxy-2-naphthoyl-CoA hydrolase n=1 Tax=Gimesia aquarii TaxID=2527964 RepID=A0A517VPZ0_9PLAN|nr:thioesterase family protein [Gimesia aquarii]QDT95010.1 1,4-dihydroxy-2-naphthoyl-CoA hydrolase [Gimesia aquarii]
MSCTFKTTRRVEFHETDMAGIVHFSNFYKYMEQAEHEYFRSLGLTIVDTQQDGSVMGWPRVSAKCSFESPVYYGDQLEIRLFVERLGVKSLTIGYEFWRDQTKVAKGRMKTVCCHFTRGNPMQSIEIPEWIQKKIEESQDHSE